MDYTTTALVKTAMSSTEATDDTQIGKLVTAASRAIDRKLSGAISSTDYLKSETVTAEVGRGIADSDGMIWYWPHKPYLTAVTSFEYRYSPQADYLSILVAWAVVDNSKIQVFASAPRGKPFVRVSYTGGLASSQSALPEDIVEAATILAVRYYKEAKSGLSDSIGVAELGMLMYTKSWPVRVLDMLAPYRRIAPVW